jgi:hypothetical protein
MKKDLIFIQFNQNFNIFYLFSINLDFFRDYKNKKIKSLNK